MVKIIKNNMKEPISITCPGCKSELEFTHEDIQRDDDNDYLLGIRRPPIRYIICPICKRNIIFDRVNLEVE